MGAATGSQLERSRLWLAQPPANLHAGVWDVVCLSAVCALNHARRHLYARRGEDPAELLQRARVEVVAEFEARLKSFAALGCVPREWADVPQTHPFLAAGDESPVRYVAPGGA